MKPHTVASCLERIVLGTDKCDRPAVIISKDNVGRLCDSNQRSEIKQAHGESEKLTVGGYSPGSTEDQVIFIVLPKRRGSLGARQYASRSLEIELS
jgi:hypothetical protein